MDTWRHFPNYQLERRADIFFALFLKEILSIRGITNISAIIPEFPVRVGEVYPETDTNRSFKIDYFVITPETVWLVELKTDVGSRRERQDDYLARSKALGLDGLLTGLLKIYDATKAKDKYRCLLDALCGAGVLVRDGEFGYAKSGVMRECEVVYVQPTRSDELINDEDEASSMSVGAPSRTGNTTKDTVITFQDIVDSGVLTGEIGERFVQSLRGWAEVTIVE